MNCSLLLVENIFGEINFKSLLPFGEGSIQTRLSVVGSDKIYMAKFPHSPILYYAYSPLLEENNSANNRLPLGLFGLHVSL